MWWTDQRGSFHYDVMVTLILVFLFVSPRLINYRDRPQETLTSTKDILVRATGPNAWTYQIGADQLADTTSDAKLRAELQQFGPSYVRKPILGREGANVMLVLDGRLLHETEGPYEGPYVYQEYCPLSHFDGNYAVLGGWIVNGYACGLGVREDQNPITQNTSRFVPHRIE